MNIMSRASVAGSPKSRLASGRDETRAVNPLVYHDNLT